MSLRISFMPSRGLIEMPPVSNVMPLPTSTTCRVAPGGCQDSSTRRGGVAEPPPTARMPPKPSAASCSGSRTVTVRPGRVAASATTWSANQAGFFIDDGVLVRSRASQTARATACAWCRLVARTPPVGDQVDHRGARALRRAGEPVAAQPEPFGEAAHRLARWRRRRQHDLQLLVAGHGPDGGGAGRAPARLVGRADADDQRPWPGYAADAASTCTAPAGPGRRPSGSSAAISSAGRRRGAARQPFDRQRLSVAVARARRDQTNREHCRSDLSVEDMESPPVRRYRTGGLA